MVTKEITNQIGSLEVRPVVDENFISDMNMDSLKFQLAEAKEIGVKKQIQIAQAKLSTAEKLKEIKEIGCLEIVVKDVTGRSSLRNIGVGTTTKLNYKKGLKYFLRQLTCNEDISENYYSIFAIDDFPATIPSGVLRSYDKLKDTNLFNEFTIWYRAKNHWDAAEGAGLVEPVEIDPYLVGRIRATDRKEQDRWFVIDSWDEKELIP